MKDLTESIALTRIGRIHFVGIGGSGMGGIAEVLLNLGYEVSGSDIARNSVTERLVERGAKVFLGHHAEQTEGASVLVVSSAIDETNEEIIAARAARIPIIPRAEMLAELMRFREGIAVAGTHGKTTTTSLLANVLAAGELDPTFVIGGRLNRTGSHSYLGEGRYLVAEADESDASFLHLQPIMAIVTNIDADHLSTYGGDFSQLQDTFIEFLLHLPFYGLAVLCADDEVLMSLLDRITRPVLTYGFSEHADIRIVSCELVGLTSNFSVQFTDESAPIDFCLNMPGKHNVQNAVAALVVAHRLGVSIPAMQSALQEFTGVGRRFEVFGDLQTPNGMITLVDDYGHHPNEIEATISAARAAFPGRRLVVAFQPHRYTRTRDLFEDFTSVLTEVDVLVLMEVYAATEDPIAGADGRSLCRAVRARGRLDPVFVEKPESLGQTLASIITEGDVVLTQGAGNVGALANELPGILKEVG